jgi:hypothetical protein
VWQSNVDDYWFLNLRSDGDLSVICDGSASSGPVSGFEHFWEDPGWNLDGIATNATIDGIPDIFNSNPLDYPSLADDITTPFDELLEKPFLADETNVLTAGTFSVGKQKELGDDNGVGFVGLNDNYSTSESQLEPHSIAQVLESLGDTTLQSQVPLGDDFSSITAINSGTLSHGFAEGAQCQFEGCGRGFKDQKSLRSHMRYHYKRHFCEDGVCRSKTEPFSTLRDLERHKDSIHRKKRLCCPICSATIRGSRKDNLERHIRKFHPGMLQ